MDEADIGLIVSETFWTVLVAVSPILGAALGIGLFIAFFQALTQIQEMTLTFVPKIVVTLLALIMSLNFIYITLAKHADRIFDLIVATGAG